MRIYFERCGPIDKFTTVEGPFRAKKGAYIIAGVSGSGKTAIAHCLYAIRRIMLREREGLDPLFWPKYARIELEPHEAKPGTENIIEIFGRYDVKGPREVGHAIIAIPHEYLMTLLYTPTPNIAELPMRWPWPRPTVVIDEETLQGLTEGYLRGEIDVEARRYRVPLSEGEFMEEITKLYIEAATRELEKLREHGIYVIPLIWLDAVFEPIHGKRLLELVKKYEEEDVALHITTYRLEAGTKKNTYIITYGLNKLSKRFNIPTKLRSILVPETALEPESEEWHEVFDALVGPEHA